MYTISNNDNLVYYFSVCRLLIYFSYFVTLNFTSRAMCSGDSTFVLFMKFKWKIRSLIIV